MAVDTFIAATGGDGFVRRYSGGSFSAVRSASSGDDAGGSSTADWGAYAEPSNPMIYRAFLPFDTSGLPDADFITAASIWVYSYGSPATGGGGSTANKSVAVVASTQASNTALATSDYPQVGTTELATRVAASSFPNGGWVEIPLNAAGIAAINATGYSKFALRIGYDLDNVEPSATGCGVLLRWADYASTTYDPYLSVTHSATQAVGTSWETPYSVGGDDVFMASAGTSDGEVRGGSNTSWADAIAQTTGTSVDNSSTTGLGGYADNNAGSARTYFLGHGFLSFDTSGLADSDSTLSGALWVWVNTKWDTGVGGTPALCLVAASQGSPLATADIDSVGSTELASRVALSGVSNGSWVKFTLNAAGLAAVNRSGTSKFAVVAAHYLDNTTPANTKYAGVSMSFGEDAAAKRPRLIVNSGTPVGASLEMPYGITGQVGRSWTAPYYLDSTRVMARLEQPYLVYNFKAGLRTAGSITTVHDAPAIYPAADSAATFPSMVRVPDPTTPFGRTIVAYILSMGQIEHPITALGDPPDAYDQIGIVFRESLDLGVTWSDYWTSGFSGGIGGLPNLGVDPVNGDIVMCWYQATGTGGDTSWMSRSSDYGHTWSTPFQLDDYTGFPAPSGRTDPVTAVMQILPLRSGKWICSVYGSDGDGSEYANATANGSIYTRCMESTDRGATWAPKGVIFPKGYNYDSRANPHQLLAAEASLVELDTGRILSVARIQNVSGATYARYWTSYSDDGGATWSTPSGPIDPGPYMTNLSAIYQTVAGDVLVAGSPQSPVGVRVLQSKNRGASFSEAFITNIAASGSNVGAHFVEVLEKDAENNVLLVYGEELWRSYNYGSPYGTATIADRGWIRFVTLGSAVSDPPEVIAGSIGHTWDLPYGMSGAVGRSWTQPYSINATAERTANGGWAWSDGVARQVTYLRLTVEHPTTGANSEYWSWYDTASQFTVSSISRTTSDTWAWVETASRTAVYSRSAGDTFTWSDSAVVTSTGPSFYSRTTSDTWAWVDAVTSSAAIPYFWLRRQRSSMSAPIKTYVQVQPKGTARTSTWTSPTYKAETEAGILVVLDVTAASGTGGLTLRINAHDQASSQAVPLNAAPSAVTATGTTSYALYPFGAVAGSVTQATSFYLPRMFSISVTHGDSSSYTYSVGFCLLP